MTDPIPPLGLSACDDFVDDLVNDWDSVGGTSDRDTVTGSKFLDKRRNGQKKHDGFKADFTKGGQNGQVARHIRGHAGAVLMYGQAGSAVSFFEQSRDYLQRFFRNTDTAKEESQAEVAADKAGRRVADAIENATKCRNNGDQDAKEKLRDELKKRLCD